jgi:hypothetical protein
MRTLRCLSVLAAVAVLGAGAERVNAFAIIGPQWISGPIVMHLALGSPASALTNGCRTWGCAAEQSLSYWNLFLNRAEFAVVRDSAAPLAAGSGITTAAFASSIYGEDFGDSTLAVALVESIGDRLIEADVLFNNRFRWNAYDGNERRDGSGPIYDFSRVSLHEFGHVLGLDHPDDYGQNVPAIMNSIIDDNDALQLDDIRGAYALYQGNTSGANLPFPPRDETLAFRVLLESKYRNDLRRAVGASYADPEGSVVWTQEFLRYRMSECRRDQAIGRVLVQIGGGGVQPVCGIAAADAAFPPRDETLAFRRVLEDVYRDDLGRLPTPTAVDVEGDVVWIQEYIRYRLSGCSNSQATDRVFRQIDGFGVQPVC